ncbi:MAG: acyl-CoA/acyl-ACP dehydrogenase [Acidimicrobiales bacterium]|nr:acyl-CoA/acyl-ACP dehydrogenase [Acidimicrobiales bacterium]
MEFALSADQESLRDAARQLLEAESPLERVRRIVGPGAGAAGQGEESHASVADFDRELWASMIEQGWPSVEQPASSGGLGLGTVELVVLSEEIGRALAPVPFVGHCLALEALRAAGEEGGPDSAAAGAWAERLTAGDAIACLGFTPGPSDGGPGTSAPRSEPTPFAPVADVAVVVGDEALFAVDLSENRPRPQPAMDRTRPLGWLALQGEPALRLGGERAARRVLDRAATATAAQLLGASDRVLAMSVAYASERVQFGRPIGGFQAVKHRLADALVDIEGMRSGVYYAAWSLGAGEPDASLAASAAKAWSSDASRRVMATALQVHGGIGFTWEHDLHLFVKRAQLDAVSYGDGDFHRDRVAGLLADRPAGAPSLF